MNTLTALLATYQYARMKGAGHLCRNEPEFRAYNVLVVGELKAAHLTGEKADSVARSPEVSFAIKALTTRMTGNHARFFRMLREAPYLMACLMAKYVKEIRINALRLMYVTRLKSYPPPAPGEPRRVPVSSSELVQMLCFVDEEELFAYVQKEERHWLTASPDEHVVYVMRYSSPPDDAAQQQQQQQQAMGDGDGDDGDGSQPTAPFRKPGISKEVLKTFPFLRFIEAKARGVPAKRLTRGEEGRFVPAVQDSLRLGPPRTVLPPSPRLPVAQQAPPSPLVKPQAPASPLQPPLASLPSTPSPLAAPPAAVPLTPFSLAPASAPPAPSQQDQGQAPAATTVAVVPDDSTLQQSKLRRKREEEEQKAQREAAEARKAERQKAEEERRDSCKLAQVASLALLPLWLNIAASAAPAAASRMRAINMERSYYLRVMDTLQGVYERHLHPDRLAKRRALAQWRDVTELRQAQASAVVLLNACLQRMSVQCAKRRALETWRGALVQVHGLEEQSRARLARDLRRQSVPPSLRDQHHDDDDDDDMMDVPPRLPSPSAARRTREEVEGARRQGLDVPAVVAPLLSARHVQHFLQLSDPQRDDRPPTTAAWKLLVSGSSSDSSCLAYTCAALRQHLEDADLRRAGLLWRAVHPLRLEGVYLQHLALCIRQLPAPEDQAPSQVQGAAALLHVLSDECGSKDYWKRERRALEKRLSGLPSQLPVLLVVPGPVYDHACSSLLTPLDARQLVGKKLGLASWAAGKQQPLVFEAIVLSDVLAGGCTEQEEAEAMASLASGLQWLADLSPPNPAVLRVSLVRAVQSAVERHVWHSPAMQGRVLGQVRPQQCIDAVNAALDEVWHTYFVTHAASPHTCSWPVPEFAVPQEEEGGGEVRGALWMDEKRCVSRALPLDWHDEERTAVAENLLAVLRLPDDPLGDQQPIHDAWDWIDHYLKVSGCHSLTTLGW